MTLRPLVLKPGVIKDDTDLASPGYATDTDKVVWWLGRAQSMGGWRTKKTGLQGVTRAMLEWATNDGTPQCAIATHKKLYVLRGTLLIDITPERSNGTLGNNPIATTIASTTVTISATAHGGSTGDTVYLRGATTVAQVAVGGSSGSLATSPFSTTVDTNRVIVTHVNHGLVSNDLVYFASATAVGGIAAVDFNTSAGLRVQRVSNDTYYVWTATVATSSASGGGTPTYTYAKPYVITVVDSDHYTIVAAPVANATNAGGGGAGVKFSFDIPIGKVDGGFSSGGFGTGLFGGGKFGIGTGTATNPVRPRIWSIDSYGEDLIANICGGAIYAWVSANPSARAAVLTNAPAISNWIVVTPERCVMSFGCTDTGGTFDPMLVRHTPPELRTTWTPATTNTAGVERASAGSRLISAKVTSRGVVCWSDTAFYTVSFVGQFDQVYRVQVAGAGRGILAGNAATESGDALWWLDQSLMHWKWQGGTPIPVRSPLHDWLLGQINAQQIEKVYAFSDRSFPAVMWLMPFGTECDNYVRFDHDEALGDPLAGWSNGTFDRTAWTIRNTFQAPLAVSSAGVVYEHNQEMAADGVAIPRHLVYSALEYEMSDGSLGEASVFISRFVPDMKRTEPVSITFTALSWPESDEPVVRGPFVIAPKQKFQDVRVKGRQIALRLDASTTSFWRFGKQRIDVSEAEQRPS